MTQASTSACTCNEGANLQRFAPGRIALQRDRSLRALGDTHAASHAGDGIHSSHAVVQRKRPKLTRVSADAAADAQLRSHPADVAGGSQHRSAVIPGLHRPTAAGAAITDGVEAAQHGVLEESVVHVAPFVLGAQDLHRFCWRDPAGTTRVMLGHETGERLADDQADVERQAGVGARGAAGAIQYHDVIGVLQHNVAGEGVGDNLLQVGQADLSLDGDQLLCRLQGHDLAVVVSAKVTWSESPDGLGGNNRPN